MSYCVNCGVELDDSARKCALCQTPVLNPNKPIQTEAETPFSEKTHIPKNTKIKFIALLISVILFVPAIVCLLIDFLFFPKVSWSIFIGSSLLLLWIIFVLPSFIKKLRPYFMWGFDTLAVALYVYLFFVMDNDYLMVWYTKGILPMIIINAILILVYMIWAKHKKRHWLLKTLHIFSACGISALLCGWIFSSQLAVPYIFSIGFIMFVCMLVLVAFLSYCYSSKSIRKWLTKKFFI